MSRSTIHLEAIDPIEIYRAANKNLEALCGYFPELKVIARGYDIILDGKETAKKFNEILKKDIKDLAKKAMWLFTGFLLILVPSIIKNYRQFYFCVL